jgi:hypothetical protein
MAKFMVILHGAPGVLQNLSPEEMQRKVEKYHAWIAKFPTGQHVPGEKLGDEGGKLLTLHKGRLQIVDGPFSEAKEVVGGFFLLRAADYEEALGLLRESPFLEDYRIELRQTDPSGCGGD